MDYPQSIMDYAAQMPQRRRRRPGGMEALNAFLAHLTGLYDYPSGEAADLMGGGSAAIAPIRRGPGMQSDYFNRLRMAQRDNY